MYQYAKANNNYMKDYDKNKESLYLKYWGIDNGAKLVANLHDETKYIIHVSKH